MMKIVKILVIRFIFLTFLLVTCWEVSSVSADVLGTSVTVVENDKQIDIKSIETDEFARGGNLSSKINLQNTSGETVKIDKVLVTVSELDGTVELTESVGVEKSLSLSRSSSLDIEFSGDLEEGEYIGLFELYSNGKLLGDSKTVITIPKSEPQVLGAADSEITNINLLVITGTLIVLLLMCVLLLFKKPLWLKKKINFGLEDVAFLIAGLSAFGLGFCVGYLAFENFLHSEMLAGSVFWGRSIFTQ